MNFDSEFNLPQGFNLSLYQKLTPKLALLADVGWSDWSEFDRQPLIIGPVAGSIDRNWHDTWRIGLGAEYRATEKWVLRSGFSFDSSPVDLDDRLPDIPVGDQYRFSAGVQHDFGQGKIFGLSYTFLYQDMDIDSVVLPPSNTVTLHGDYNDAYLHIIGISLNISF